MKIRTLTKVAAASALALAAAACSSGSSGGSAPAAAASAQPPVTVTLAVSNITNQTYIPLVLAQQLGLFKKQGLNVKLDITTSGSTTFTAMLSGQADGVIGFYDHNIDLQAKGESTESVVQLLQAPGMVEIVRADEASTITSPADLAGKKIGITGLGSSTEFIADYLASRAGVAVSSLHPVSVQAGSTFVAAMQNGQIDVGVTTEPTISALLAKHLGKIIVDLRTVAGTEAVMGGLYPGTSLTFTTSYVQAHQATVQKMVDALVAALQYIQQHSAAQITAAMPASYYSSTGEAAYTEALANEIGMYSPTGLMPTDGPQSVLRVLSEFDPAVIGKTVDLEKTYTDSFVQAVPTS